MKTAECFGITKSKTTQGQGVSPQEGEQNNEAVGFFKLMLTLHRTVLVD